jgi:transposase
MVKTLSLNLRERVVAAVSEGMSCRQAAARFGVRPASAIRWCSLQHDTGSFKAKPQGGDRRSGRIEAQAQVSFSLLHESSDITLMELQDKLAAGGQHFGIGTLWRFFHRHGLTWKKTANASEQDSPDVAQERPWRSRDRLTGQPFKLMSIKFWPFMPQECVSFFKRAGYIPIW